MKVIKLIIINHVTNGGLNTLEIRLHRKLVKILIIMYKEASIIIERETMDY